MSDRTIIGNLLLAALMDAPDALSDRCTIPGCETPHYRLENHHVVSRSQGGGDGPLRTLCWNHHELCRLRLLHFDYDAGWFYRETVAPMKYDAALRMLTGWRPL